MGAGRIVVMLFDVIEIRSLVDRDRQTRVVREDDRAARADRVLGRALGSQPSFLAHRRSDLRVPPVTMLDVGGPSLY